MNIQILQKDFSFEYKNRFWCLCHSINSFRNCSFFAILTLEKFYFILMIKTKNISENILKYTNTFFFIKFFFLEKSVKQMLYNLITDLCKLKYM